jgi:hypothetical protein
MNLLRQALKGTPAIGSGAYPMIRQGASSLVHQRPVRPKLPPFKTSYHGGSTGGGPSSPFDLYPPGHYQMTKYKDPGHGLGDITAPRGPGGFGGSMIAGALMGGGSGYVMSGEDNKAFGTIGGALAGMAGGAGMRSFATRGSSVTNRAFNATNSRLSSVAAGGIGEQWKKNRHVVHKGLQGFHSAAGRNTVFRSGAMLGGGAFGAMFASNGRSHKRGFNRSRGNSFSR